MQKRHFELIAATIKGSALPTTELRHVAYLFADALAETHPKFNRARFLKACGVEW